MHLQCEGDTKSNRRKWVEAGFQGKDIQIEIASSAGNGAMMNRYLLERQRVDDPNLASAQATAKEQTGEDSALGAPTVVVASQQTRQDERTFPKEPKMRVSGSLICISSRSGGRLAAAMQHTANCRVLAFASR